MMNWILGFVIFTCVENVVNSQVWPSGTYAIPKSISGCPLNWQEGWILQDLENTNSKTEFSSDLNLHMEATLTGNDVKRSFCVKTSTNNGETRLWPAGSYCVYRKNQCPSGMKSGSIKWDDEDSNNDNKKSGILPNGTFNKDTIIEYCCQDQGVWTNSIELPVDKPFYLLPHASINCQRVKGAISMLDYITYDTEEENNHDDFTPSHVFTDNGKGLPKIYYCYYKGCQHKVQQDSGNISTLNFPSYQYCSWSVTVSQGFVVSLTLTSINIPSCNGNYMNIYDGVDDTAPVLMSLCGNNATNGTRLLSTGNMMFMMLKSGRDSQNMYFQGNFTSTKPPSGLSWPSGTYSLPKTTTSCPHMWIPGWRKQIMEDDERGGLTSLSTDLHMHMDVSLVDNAITRHFCTKTIDSGGSQHAWPPGEYCIYKKNQCQPGMKEGFIKWDDEDYPNKDSNDKYGTLPNGDYKEKDTQISYCCNDQGDWKQSIQLPINEPFYLLPHKTYNCQRVKGALSTLEYIIYDTEEDNNHDDFHSSHAYTTGGKGLPKVYYCYYTGCKYELNTDNGNFGADNYPSYQFCSWSITVRNGLKVFLEFTTINIPDSGDCSKNQLKIYDGVDSTASLLATYCNKNATSGNTLRSTGNRVYVVFLSGLNNDLQFQARYAAQESITEPEWPSGTYGLPKTTESCPVGWVQGSRKQDMESSGVFYGAISPQLYMDADFNQVGRYITRKFCMKTHSGQNARSWPPGSYCVYKKNTCSTGMSDGFIEWDDEDDSKSNSKNGILPDGQYGTDTKIYYCCRTQGYWYDPIDLPVSTPIFLLPYKSKNCQRVKWAMSKLQFITYDTEDDNNMDKFQSNHVYTENKHNDLPTIYYCYYEGCQHKINAESPSNISVSTTTNQDFQFCSWLLSVRYGNISLVFSSISVPNCGKSNYIEIHDGPNEQSQLLARYCGTTTVTGGNITSSSKHMFMLVKSGNNVKMETTLAFEATFKNNVPFGVSVPSPATDTTTGKTTKLSTTLATTTQTTLQTSQTSARTSSTTAILATTLSTSTTTKITTSTTSSKSSLTTLLTSQKTTKKTLPKSPTTSPSTLPTTPPKTSPSTTLTTHMLRTTLKITIPVRKTTRSSTSTRSSTHALPASTPVSTKSDISQATTPVSTKSDTSQATTTVSTKPDITPPISETTRPGIDTVSASKELIEPTTKSGEEGGTAGKSGQNGDGSSSSTLVIVIPVCITFLATVVIVMIFYRRRQMKDNPTQGSTDHEHQHSNQMGARFRPPDQVNIIPNGEMEKEKNNPLYESGEEHNYCTIEDVQEKYKKEIGLSNKLSQSTLYETPVDPEASTSSFNQVDTKENKKKTNLYEISELGTSNRPKLPQKDNPYETPIDQGASFNPLYNKEGNNKNPDVELTSSPTLPFKQSSQKTPLLPKSHDTPEPHYKSPGNPYDTKLPPKDTSSPYDITPMNAAKQQPRVPYQNVSNANNNSHYQTPKADTGVYEVMHGREHQVDLAESTGMTQC